MANFLLTSTTPTPPLSLPLPFFIRALPRGNVESGVRQSKRRSTTCVHLIASLPRRRPTMRLSSPLDERSVPDSKFQVPPPHVGRIDNICWLGFSLWSGVGCDMLWVVCFFFFCKSCIWCAFMYILVICASCGFDLFVLYKLVREGKRGARVDNSHFFFFFAWEVFCSQYTGLGIIWTVLMLAVLVLEHFSLYFI